MAKVEILGSGGAFHNPKAPYSPASKVGNLVFVAGTVAFGPDGQVVGAGDAGAQTAQVMENIKAVLAAAGATLQDVARTTVWLRDLADYAAMNEVYTRYFGDHKPPRATVRADLVRDDLLVEIECIAVAGG